MSQTGNSDVDSQVGTGLFNFLSDELGRLSGVAAEDATEIFFRPAASKSSGEQPLQHIAPQNACDWGFEGRRGGHQAEQFAHLWGYNMSSLEYDRFKKLTMVSSCPDKAKNFPLLL